MSIALDALDTKAASVYDGYLVRKDLVRRYSRQYPVPTYVVEFLLGRYCASTDEKEIAEGLEIVEKQLKDRTVRTGDQEIFKARARETGPVKLIDIVKARLDTRNDCYDRRTAQPRAEGRSHRGQPGSRARADAHRRVLRRGDALVRRNHRPATGRQAVRD